MKINSEVNLAIFFNFKISLNRAIYTNISKYKIYSQIQSRPFQGYSLKLDNRFFVRTATHWTLESCWNVSPVSRRCDIENRSMRTISGAEKYLEGPTGNRGLSYNFNPIFSSRRSTFRPSCARQLTQQPLSANVNILLPTYTTTTAAVSCLLFSDQDILQVTRFLMLTISFEIKI